MTTRRTYKRRNSVGTEPRLVEAFGKIVELIPRKGDSRGCYEDSYKTDQPTARKEFYSFLVAEKHELANVHTDGCTWADPCGECSRCLYEATRDAAIEDGLIVKVAFKGRDGKRGGVKLYTPEEASTFKTRSRAEFKPTKLTELVRAGL